MKFTLLFVTLSDLAFSNAKLPRPLKDCEDKVLSFECPDGQKPFPFLGEECSGISSGDDIPKRDLKGMNPCKGATEVKKDKKREGKCCKIIYKLNFLGAAELKSISRKIYVKNHILTLENLSFREMK